MRNVKNTLPSTVVFSVPASLAALSHSVLADELGGLAGGGDEYHSLALDYQAAPFWQGELAAHPLDVSLEYSLGMIRPPSGQSLRDLWLVGVMPFAHWWFATNTGIEMGVGANVSSGTHLGDKEISTAFQFGSSIGLFHRLPGASWLLGLRLTHYSNADIKRPNPGQDYIQLRASYVFN